MQDILQVLYATIEAQPPDVRYTVYPLQLGLELEYWTVDNTGVLAPAKPVLDRIDSLHAESADPMLEIVTDPCDDVSQLREEVTTRLRAAIDVAREENRRLVPLATPLNAGSISTSDSPRTRIQRQVLGERFANATYCAGTHLHVDQIDGAETDQLNLLTALDPAFALVASASHHQGDDVARCARSHIYRQECYGSHPELGQLWPYVETTADWDARISSTFSTRSKRCTSASRTPNQHMRFTDETLTQEIPYDLIRSLGRWCAVHRLQSSHRLHGRH
ncbi:glutamate-cysteine ligase family protein [Halalkalicoccus salilacus]|uniref:glutamate-cysteine ligase family protein n=1 Tax=Halalkalicoccus salilacus TaxID=3117459 RepID=UPI0038D43272